MAAYYQGRTACAECGSRDFRAQHRKADGGDVIDFTCDQCGVVAASAAVKIKKRGRLPGSKNWPKE
jgi:hypothetical protein